ncbi:MAG: hypothetical protein BGO21_16175 [Dyadobacter sp. 50-39]|uniref:hypothetical protein n=1 Tax=Dyadobacter sp. 50-39 TaxID=1895756 RepID=UPI000963C16C|nr:hypothetical protein [Dyadobacter sp. 50-39]OJV14280.1 MAG: hypothetical protein BGO21_16175 [Dyadobacter sp. 50-39]
MSLTQVDFFILPGSCLVSDDRNNFKLDEEGLFEDDIFWRDSKPSPEVFLPVEDILGRSPSWHNDLIMYGSQESNRLQVWVEENLVVSASFRIDFTAKYEDILCSLLEFFILNGLKILDGELNVVALNVEAVNGVIVNTTQYRFYRNIVSEDLGNK